ncbi:MAG TPA: cation:proton antiporter [Acidobacteriaceae bacterium]|nr:cation:proton antiporter [Acidobacteriaceae bacterium]
MHASISFIELGTTVIGLAILARIASRWGFSAIPLYLLAGLAFGNGGMAPLDISTSFIHGGAEIGVLLLLFMLGLEYTGHQLTETLRSGFSAGVIDFVLNFAPGLVFGLVLGWKPMPAVLLGGVTYISSSGVIAKVLAELRRLDFPETPIILSVLVLEDLAMAVYLPLVAVLIAGGTTQRLILSVCIAVVTVCIVLFAAVRFGPTFSRFVAHESEEIILLTTFGTVLLVAGIAEQLQVSAAIGAFLVGIAVSGPLAEQSHRLLAPLRDLFAALFFFFFGLQIDPKSLKSMLGLAVLLGLITAATKVLTGYWAGQRGGIDQRGRFRAGTVLIARGEFSIVIAALGVGLEPKLGPLSAAYVLFLAALGPICARIAK